MDGKNNKKDPLERFFQKKAGEYDIPYNEEDWLKLEKKLDLRDAQLAYRKKLSWIAAASLLIISLLGYYTFENHNRLNELSQQLSSVETPPGTGEEPVVEGLSPLELERPGTTNEQNGTIDGNNSVQGEHSASQPVPFDDLATEQTIPEMAEGIEQPGEETSPPYDLLGLDSFSHDLVTSQLSCPSCALSRLTSSDEITALVRIEQRGSVIDSESLLLADSRGLPEAGEIRDDFGRGRSSHVAAGLVLSPDLSTVGSISNFYDPGYKAGFTLEYNLSPNLAIMTGVIQTMVRYTASDRQYRPPIYWTGGIAPDEIVGECLLLDIPISFKFDFLHFNHSRFFATAGLSSYIMLNEDYYFSYDNDDPGLIQGWSGETGTRHWLSNAGFSIGYELDVYSNWSLRVEPFLKVPLKEVGWGNVKLYSMGSFVSINYKL